ncbi:MAG: GNAT family N-acetyltransferase [Lachnospiraceae bacterium]|nr:GNAT family N-acetyltransferase [Lachnospiraceae bacterium]
MELVSNYMRDDTLRHALNDLTKKTFGFDFEDWVTGGYFEGDYIPYSFIEDGKIISNVSANRMTFLQNGVERNYIQIGTVMTDEAYRRHGLAKKLMEHVVNQYKDSCDGFYLFANLDAVDFYDKCGFSKETEYRYFVKDEFCRRKSAGEIFLPVNTADERMKQKYMDRNRTVSDDVLESEKIYTSL